MDFPDTAPETNFFVTVKFGAVRLYLFEIDNRAYLVLLQMQIPFCVVVGWFMGKPMDLNFQLFETATLFITVLVVAFMLQVRHST